MDKSKAKSAVSVAVEAKPEVEIMAATQKFDFLTLVSYSLLQTVLAKTYRFATIQNVTDRDTDRQTTDRRHSVPKARLIVRSAKN